MLKIDTAFYRPPLAVFLEYRKEGYLDQLVQLSHPPLSVDVDLGQVILLDLKANVEPMARQLGTTYNAMGAILDVVTLDCDGQPAADKATLTWFDSDANTVTRSLYSYSGGPIAMNLPVNAANITRIAARAKGTNHLITSASVVVRPGTSTTVYIRPTP